MPLWNLRGQASLRHSFAGTTERSEKGRHQNLEVKKRGAPRRAGVAVQNPTFREFSKNRKPSDNLERDGSSSIRDCAGNKEELRSRMRGGHVGISLSVPCRGKRADVSRGNWKCSEDGRLLGTQPKKRELEVFLGGARTARWYARYERSQPRLKRDYERRQTIRGLGYSTEIPAVE